MRQSILPLAEYLRTGCDTSQGARFVQINAHLQRVAAQTILATPSLSASEDGRGIAFVSPDAVHFSQTLRAQY